MTSLSQWLRAEEVDKTEPACFYYPGVVSWSDVEVKRQQARRALEIRWDAKVLLSGDVFEEDDDVSG